MPRFDLPLLGHKEQNLYFMDRLLLKQSELVAPAVETAQTVGTVSPIPLTGCVGREINELF